MPFLIQFNIFVTNGKQNENIMPKPDFFPIGFAIELFIFVAKYDL